MYAASALTSPLPGRVGEEKCKAGLVRGFPGISPEGKSPGCPLAQCQQLPTFRLLVFVPDFCDGASLSRPRPRATSFALTSTPAALLGHDRHLQEAERYSFADENQDGKAEGQLGMNPSTGDFSVTEKIGG